MNKMVVLLFILFGLRVQSQSVRTLRVNPDYARGGAVSELFDTVMYIPLETTKESVFGNIQNLQVTRHYFVFYDYSTRAIFAFTRKGKFAGKITTAPGLFKQNYWALRSFVVNPYSEHIYLAYNTWHGREQGEDRLAVFKPDGRLLSVKTLDSTQLGAVEVTDFAFVDSNTTLHPVLTQKSTGNAYFVRVRDFSRVSAFMDPMAENDPFRGRSKNYHNSTVSAGYSIWSRSYDYTHKIMENGQLGRYRFLLPRKLSLDSAFYKDTALIGDARRSMTFNKEHRGLVTIFNNLYKSGPLLFFTLVKGNQASVYDSYFYNVMSHALYNFSKITPDSSNGFLPVISVSPGAADEQYIYCEVPAYTLFQAEEMHRDRHPVYSPVMKNYFATKDRKSNSVIVVLKPKSNL